MSYNYERLYFQGAGVLKLAPVAKATGLICGPYILCGDNGGATLNGSYETYEVSESETGLSLPTVSKRRKPKLEMVIKVRSLSAQMRAYIFGGTAAKAESVPITGKVLGDVEPGKFYPFGDFKSTITEAKTGADVTIPTTNYTVHNDGTVSFTQAYTGVTVTGATGSFDYTNIMSALSQEVAVLCDVKNMAAGEDDGEPGVLQFYRAVISPLDKFDLIQTNGDIAEIDLKLTILAAPAGAQTFNTGLLKGFGYFA